MHGLNFTLGIHQDHWQLPRRRGGPIGPPVFQGPIFQYFPGIFERFNRIAAAAADGECSGFIQYPVLFQLFLQHHHVKFLMQIMMIQPKNPESVPPAEMVAYNQKGFIRNIRHGRVHRKCRKIPLQPDSCVPPEEPDVEPGVPGWYHVVNNFSMNAIRLSIRKNPSWAASMVPATWFRILSFTIGKSAPSTTDTRNHMM